VNFLEKKLKQRRNETSDLKNVNHKLLTDGDVETKTDDRGKKTCTRDLGINRHTSCLKKRGKHKKSTSGQKRVWIIALKDSRMKTWQTRGGKRLGDLTHWLPGKAN